MAELFHPDLPGVAVADVPARRAAGWKTWRALSEDEQAAHKKAVAAAEKADRAAVKARRDAWAAAKESSATAGEAKPPKKSTKAPTNGDTPKE